MDKDLSVIGGRGFPTSLQRRAKFSLDDFARWPDADNVNKSWNVPRFIDTAGYVGRFRTYVVIEIIEGHQVIEHWKCNDLVQHVNKIIDQYSHLEKDKVEYWIQKGQKSLEEFKKQQNTNESSCENTYKHRESQLIHHHHYYNGPTKQKSRQIQEKNQHQHPLTSAASRLCYRDLRQIFTDGSPVPSIETRQHCIIVCLPPLSCIIMADRVFILVVEDLGMDQLISNLRNIQLKYMKKSGVDQQNTDNPNELEVDTSNTELSSSSIDTVTSMIRNSKALSSESVALPLEIQSLELLMSAAFEQLDSDILFLEKSYAKFSSEALQAQPTTESNAQLHYMANQTRAFQDRVTLYDRAINTIISDQEDLTLLELSKLKHEQQLIIGTLLAAEQMNENFDLYDYTSYLRSSSMDANPEIDDLLEFFDQEIEMFRQRLSRLIEKLDCADKFFTFKLSLNRTKMIHLDVISSLLGAVCGLSTALSGLFGMNLLNGFEESQVAFYSVTFGVILLTILAGSGVIFFVRRIRL